MAVAAEGRQLTSNRPSCLLARWCPQVPSPRHIAAVLPAQSLQSLHVQPLHPPPHPTPPSPKQIVEPKIQKLREAEAELRAATRERQAVEEELGVVQGRLDGMQAQFDAAMAQKQVGAGCLRCLGLTLSGVRQGMFGHSC